LSTLRTEQAIERRLGSCKARRLMLAKISTPCPDRGTAAIRSMRRCRLRLGVLVDSGRGVGVPRSILSPPKSKKPLGRLTKGVGPTIEVLGHVARGAPTQKPSIRRLGGQASGCCCFFGDHFGHSSVTCKGQALAWSDLASSGGRLDSPPGTMCWKADNGIANMSASAAALAGGVRVGRGADRNASPGRCVAW